VKEKGKENLTRESQPSLSQIRKKGNSAGKSERGGKINVELILEDVSNS
jgi:hypothetical protein